MERKTLPAREKQIREDESHLFCPGEGCSARLGIRKGLTITLERRYTNAPHPSYPAGTWWKQERGGYKGMPRARDARRAMRDLHKAIEGIPLETPLETLREAADQVAKETLRRRDLLNNVYTAQAGKLTAPAAKRLFREYTEWRREELRRGSSIFSWGRWHARPRPALPPGTHTVVCSRCEGAATIDGGP
jgi:hypothetical protein